MSCGLNGKFDTAVDAVKEAFKAAVDTKDFDRSTLSEVWRHYQGLQTIAEGLPEHAERPDLGPDLVNIQFPDGTYNPDYNITLPTGDITFDTNDLAFDTSEPVTFTTPELKENDKIVL